MKHWNWNGRRVRIDKWHRRFLYGSDLYSLLQNNCGLKQGDYARRLSSELGFATLRLSVKVREDYGLDHSFSPMVARLAQILGKGECSWRMLVVDTCGGFI